MGRGHNRPGEARGTQGGFWGREVILDVSRNLVCCRGFYAIKRFLRGGYRGLSRLQRGMKKYWEYGVNTGGS